MELSSKDEFYYKIKEDYDANFTDSFIYNYIWKQKEGRVSPEEYLRNKDKVRRDPYITLKSCYLAYSLKKIKSLELADLLKGSIKDLKRDEIAGVLKIVEDLNDKKPTKKQLTEIICEEIDKEFESGSLGEDGVVKRLVDALSCKYLSKEIYDYLYNVENDRTDIDGRRRRNDDALDMMFGFLKSKRYAEDNNSVKVACTNRLDDNDYEEDCKKLYDFINDLDQEEGVQIFVPVMIDTETGMGIYMVGSEYVASDEKDKKNCYYCILRFDPDEDFGGNIYEHDSYNWTGTKEFFDVNKTRFMMTCYIESQGSLFSEIGKAKAAYSAIKNNYFDYDGYGEVNEKMADVIGGCEAGKRFGEYFVTRDKRERRPEEANKKEEAINNLKEERKEERKKERKKEEIKKSKAIQKKS